MIVASEEVIGVQDWLTDSSIDGDTQRNRKVALTHYCNANGKTVVTVKNSYGRLSFPLEEVVKATEQILDEIKNGKVTLYSTAKRMVDTLRMEGLKPGTIRMNRSFLPSFFQSVLGEGNFKQTVFDRLVKAEKAQVSITKNVPTVEDVQNMLRIAIPEYRAFVGILACTGMRLNEVIALKMSDLEVRPSGVTRIKLGTSSTKAREVRYCFLTKEVARFVKEHHTGLTSEWLFPGYNGAHLVDVGAWRKFKELCKKVGLKDTESETYTVHSMRIFADSAMSRAGIDRKFIELIIGHKNALGASASYKDWEEAERQFIEAEQSGKLTWLSEKIEVVKEIVDSQARRQNKFLLELFGGMLSPEQRKQLDTMIAQNEDMKALQLFPVGTLSQMTPEKKKELQTKWKDSVRKRLEDRRTEKSV